MAYDDILENAAAPRGRQIGFWESWRQKTTRRGSTTGMLVNPTGAVKNSGGLTTVSHAFIAGSDIKIATGTVRAGSEGSLGKHMRENMADISDGDEFVPAYKKTRAAPITKTAYDLMLEALFNIEN